MQPHLLLGSQFAPGTVIANVMVNFALPVLSSALFKSLLRQLSAPSWHSVDEKFNKCVRNLFKNVVQAYTYFVIFTIHVVFTND